MMRSFSHYEVNANPVTAPHKVNDMLTCGLRTTIAKVAVRHFGNQPTQKINVISLCWVDVVTFGLWHTKLTSMNYHCKRLHYKASNKGETNTSIQHLRKSVLSVFHSDSHCCATMNLLEQSLCMLIMWVRACLIESCNQYCKGLACFALALLACNFASGKRKEKNWRWKINKGCDVIDLHAKLVNGCR